MAAFVGVHPKLTHDPPTSLRSATATRFPAFASAWERGIAGLPGSDHEDVVAGLSFAA